MTWMLWFFVGYVPVLAVVVAGLWRLHGGEPSGQHSGSGDGALTVEYLISRVATDRETSETYGRHALRESALLRGEPALLRTV